MDTKTRTEIETTVFRRLLEHLRNNPEVQNIDLMNLAGFCRNCLGKWYKTAAEAHGFNLEDGVARDIIYGMPYNEWKAKHQKPASKQQLEHYADNKQ
jgi:uncharacterized protein